MCVCVSDNCLPNRNHCHTDGGEEQREQNIEIKNYARKYNRYACCCLSYVWIFSYILQYCICKNNVSFLYIYLNIFPQYRYWLSYMIKIACMHYDNIWMWPIMISTRFSCPYSTLCFAGLCVWLDGALRNRTGTFEYSLSWNAVLCSDIVRIGYDAYCACMMSVF